MGQDRHDHARVWIVAMTIGPDVTRWAKQMARILSYGRPM